MQKKIIALAIAAALAAPAAFAETVVYGKLSADFESVKNTIPSVVTAPVSTTRMTSNASRFGVKGSEDLGNGMSAIYQVETRVNLIGTETTTPAGGVATNLGVFNGMRNSNLGLKGDFGTVFLGHWDTPFKTAHNKVELFDNTSIATSTSLLGNNGSNLTGGAFNVRENSSVQYWTPNMSGFQAKVAYGKHNSVAPTTTLTPSTLSMSGEYENAMFYAALAYESHTAWAATTAIADKDSGSRLVGAYKFDGGLVGLTYENLTANRAGVSKSRAAYELAANYAMGANNFGAFYTKAGNLGGVAATGANKVSLRYGYNFSKRTEAFAMYTSQKNDTAANYGIADVANGIAGAAGTKISGFGVGLAHSF